MNKFISKHIVTKAAKTALAVILLGGLFVVASAFTDPTQVPPNGNVPAPINTGASTQQKTGSLLLGSSPASPAVGGSLVTGRNVYTADTNTNDAIFAGELSKAHTDFPTRALYGVGWESLSGRAGFFGADFRVMDSSNTALLKNIFAGKVYADDYWIGALNTWASKLAASVGGTPSTPPTPNLQQVTEAGNNTKKDVVLEGNVWMSKGLSTPNTAIDPSNTPTTGVYSNHDIVSAGNVVGKDVWLSQPNNGASRWASQPPRLDATVTNASGGNGQTIHTECPSGYTRTGGGVAIIPNSVDMLKSYPDGNGWTCYGATGRGDASVQCYAVCTRIVY